jgi:alpha-1,2-mannosyltransferase
MTYRARHARISTGDAARTTARPGPGRPADAAAAGKPATPGRGPSATALLVIGAAAFAGALATFGLHAAHPSFLTRMFDLGSYRDGGLIVRHAYHFRPGQPTSLYDWVSPRGGNPFAYPPFAAGIFAVLSFLTPVVLQWGMTALSLGALIAAIWLTMDSAGLPKGPARAGAALLVCAVALWIQPVQSNLSLGQISLLLMAAIIWDLRRTGDGDTRWWVGAATGIAAGIELTPLIFIPYLLMTRRFRQAAVAAGAFAATVGIGFAVMPGASATYWGRGLLDRVNGTPHANAGFFFASAWNQSLRGVLSRLTLHAPDAATPWLLAALLTAAFGLLCATWLHNDGFPMLGMLTCALTGLLISPVSWVHSWVWIGPWIAALAATAWRARGAARGWWLGAVGLVTLTFVKWPVVPYLTGSKRGLHVVADVPMKQPLPWHGLQFVAGNSYVLAGAAGLLALLGWGVARASRPGFAGRPAPLAERAQPVAEPASAISGAVRLIR